MCYSLWYNAPPPHDVAGRWPATSWVHCTTSCNTRSSAPEDGGDHRPKGVELIGIINKPLLLQLVGVYITYCFSTATVVARTRLNVTLYVHASLVSVTFGAARSTRRLK